MGTIRENLDFLKNTLLDGVRIIAISKTKPISSIMEAYEAGQRVFGENKAQELSTKQSLLPNDIEWHFIGHLQTNKVKLVAPFIGMIHSVDGLKLLQEINKEALKNNRIIPCLLQFYIATEETKFGLNLEEATELLSSPIYGKLSHVSIQGVMGMASFTDNQALIRQEFKNLHHIFTELKHHFFSDRAEFREISMGMSGDYTIAMEEGSTMIRIGSLIFGEREYPI